MIGQVKRKWVGKSVQLLRTRNPRQGEVEQGLIHAGNLSSHHGKSTRLAPNKAADKMAFWHGRLHEANTFY